MTNYPLISNYKQNETYKESFNELAKMVFGLDFKKWYEKGCWNDNYICYSYLDGDNIIANASVNKMTVVSNGKEYRALQIGTVMTHPDYRQQGLSGKLMDHIIDKYEKDYDFIYLFANDTVLDFYPKFGFEQVQESHFSLDISHLNNRQATPLLQLDPDDPSDFQLLQNFATERVPVSSILGVKDNEHLLLFYFILAFDEAIYYSEEEKVIILFEHEEDQLHIFDIISKKEITLDKVINLVATANTKTVHFHFTPDDDNKDIKKTFITESDDVLFVRPLLKGEAKHFLFPLTSHA